MFLKSLINKNLFYRTYEAVALNKNIKSASQYKFLKNLTPAEKVEFFDSFDTVFCDCDGVIWHALREGIPGSAEAIDYLRKKGKKVTFVTNHSISSTEDQIKKFKSCNIEITKNEIIHPAQTVCDYLKSIGFDGLILCLGNAPFKNLLREAGFQLVENENRILEESLHDLRSAIYSDDEVKAIVIDVDFNLTAAKLMRAHVHLKDPECLLIGGAADTAIPFGGGEVMGPGLFLDLVEKSSKRQAIVLGKPGLELSRILKARYDLFKRPERALFIGDTIGSDIKFGNLCGFQTLLVLSGGTKLSDLTQNLPDDEMPDYVIDSLHDLCKII